MIPKAVTTTSVQLYISLFKDIHSNIASVCYQLIVTWKPISKLIEENDNDFYREAGICAR